MSKKRGDFRLSRRSLIRGLGAVAAAALPGIGSAENKPGGRPYAPLANISDGYTDKQSYRPGDRVTLFLNTDTPQEIATVRLFDYSGLRRVYEFPSKVTTQTPVGPTPWATGFGYEPSGSFILPDLPSGVYMVERIIPLIVKAPLSRPADILIVYPTNTCAAYNGAGGRSLYSQPVKATSVSFERPAGSANVAFHQAFLRWLDLLDLPYSIKFVADIDLDDYSEISGSKVLMLIGHSEYWTRTAREHFDQFVLGGGQALILAGNTMWWQVRYSDDRRQMTCYKGVHDPIADPLLRTINWPKPSLEYSVVKSIGADFDHGGFGIGYPNAGGFRVLSPKSPVFDLVEVHNGDTILMPTVEYDGTHLLNSPVTAGVPQLDMSALGAYRAEIIGYADCFRNDADTGAGSVPDSVGTWIVFQRTATSGVVMNGASTNWCSYEGVQGPDGIRIRRIILNMFDILVNKKSAFSS
jgi:hypothetical protein